MSFHKSIVTNAVNTEKTFTNNYGVFYLHAINFADGGHGEYMSKDPNQQTFVVGQEKDYELIPTDSAYPDKIKPYNPEYAQQSQQTAQAIAPQPAQTVTQAAPFKQQLTQQQAINKTVALKEAVNLANDTDTTDKVLAYADAFDNWLNGLYVKGPINDPNNVDPDGIPL